MSELSSETRQEMMEAIFAGRKITAIKIYRDATSTGLKESKEFIEDLTARLREQEPDRFTAASKSGCAAASLLLFCAALSMLAVLAIVP